MATSDSNLLFGILALQVDFITRDQLVVGMQAWVNEKTVSLAEHLARAGALSLEDRQAMELLLSRHIWRHGNPQQSLMALSTAEEVKAELQSIEDYNVQQSVALIPSRSAVDPQATVSVFGTTSQVGTRFRVLRLYAEGGQGKVSLARDEELGREVAFKEIKPRFADDEAIRARFVREAEITGGLEHPGIVPVYGLGVDDLGRPFYAMRFIKGDSLKDAIAAYHAPNTANVKPKSPTERNLELRRLLQRMIDVCEAMEYAHSRGVLHRDLKPGNIMLGKYGETLVVDWGLARPQTKAKDSCQTRPLDSEATLVPRSGDSSATTVGSMIGTPAFMSPEQAQGKLDLLTPQSDVYSLGATLYSLLSGKLPVLGDDLTQVLDNVIAGRVRPPREHDRSIPKQLEAICLKALAREPAQRYASARQLAADLEKWMADEPVSAISETALDRASRWMRRNRHWVQAGGIAIMFFAVTAIGAYFYQRETAAKNLKLAQEKGNLAEEKGKLAEEKEKLASEKSDLADEANRKANELRISLAHNYFEHGVSEYAAGRLDAGVLNLQRAWSMLDSSDPLRRHYETILWDRATRGGRTPIPPLRHEGRVNSVAFSPDGTRVATGSSDHTAQLWDAQTGRPLGEALRHDDVVQSVAFSPDGSRLATTSNNKTARLWEMESNSALGKPIQHSVGSVVFSSDGTRLITAADNTAQFWNAQTGEWAHLVSLNHRFKLVACHPDGTLVATNYEDPTAQLWELQTGKPLGKPLQHDGLVLSVLALSADGTQVATTSWDNEARLWSVQTGKPLGEPMRHEDIVNSVAFSPDGTRVATASSDHTVRLWDTKTGKPLGEPLRHDGNVQFVVFSPDGTCLATSDNNTARLWEVETSGPLKIPLEEGMTSSFAFRADGIRLASATSDQLARSYWDVLTGRRLQYRVAEGELLSVSMAPSPDGSRLAIAVDDGAVRRKMRGRGPLNILNEVKVSIAVGPAERPLEVNVNRTAQQVSAQTGRFLGEPLHNWVTSIAYSPDGMLLATGSEDKTARLWDVQTGKPLGTPMLHNDVVRSVIFSQDGKRLATASGEHTAWLWEYNLPPRPRDWAPIVALFTGNAMDQEGNAHALGVQEIKNSHKSSHGQQAAGDWLILVAQSLRKRRANAQFAALLEAQHRNDKFATTFCAKSLRKADELSERERQWVELTLAYGCLADGKFDELRQCVRAVLDRFPEDYFGAGAATILPNTGVTDAEYQKLLEVSNKLPDAKSNRPRGQLLLRLKEYDAALAEFAKNLNPKRASDYFFIALAQHAMGNYDDARASFAKGVEWIQNNETDWIERVFQVSLHKEAAQTLGLFEP